MEIGVFTFADTRFDPESGRRSAPSSACARSSRRSSSPTRSASTSSASASTIGPDFAVSAPAVVLAAIAARTKRIRLTSAVTVLSSDDPVRVFQEFATARSPVRRPRRDHGRPRLVHRVVPALRVRPPRLRRAVRREARRCCSDSGEERVTWSGRHRPPHRPGRLPASGRRSRCRSGSRSAARRSRRCAPGRSACRWRSRSSAGCRSASRRSPSSTAAPPREAGHDPLPALSINSHGYIAETPQQALDESFPYVSARDEPDRARARLAADGRAPTTTPRRRCAARTSSAARSRSSRRSSSSTSSSATTASCSSSRSAACPHDEDPPLDRAPRNRGRAGPSAREMVRLAPIAEHTESRQTMRPRVEGDRIRSTRRARQPHARRGGRPTTPTPN